MKQPRVALVHDYLVQYGGAEKTLEVTAELFPDAPIYAGIYNPKDLTDYLNSRKIISSKSFLHKYFTKYFTFLMPLVFEGFDLSEYDLIISDGTAWPKGVLTKPEQLHISYIHTPPRFMYGYSVETTKRNAWYLKPFVCIIDHFLRNWDYVAAQRPNFLLANSQETRKRILKFYNRDAYVLYPPVDTVSQAKNKKAGKIVPKKPYFVALGRLAAYKNFDVLIKAFKNLDLSLVIVGTGKEEKRLKKLGGESVIFAGRVSHEEKHALLENALGLINTVGDEDFGIVPVEAMLHGTPVLAHRSSGHLETVKEGLSGMFFDALEPKALAESIKKFNEAIQKGEFDRKKIKQSVQKFSKDRFKKELYDLVMEKWQAHVNQITARKE